jgi:hypothetical protein
MLALETLARVLKLPLPSLQVSIGLGPGQGG